jgi:hypothetical protein
VIVERLPEAQYRAERIETLAAVTEMERLRFAVCVDDRCDGVGGAEIEANGILHARLRNDENAPARTGAVCVYGPALLSA